MRRFCCPVGVLPVRGNRDRNGERPRTDRGDDCVHGGINHRVRPVRREGDTTGPDLRFVANGLERVHWADAHPFVPFHTHSATRFAYELKLNAEQFKASPRSCSAC
jgi:hypothetical protein